MLFVYDNRTQWNTLIALTPIFSFRISHVRHVRNCNSYSMVLSTMKGYIYRNDESTCSYHYATMNVVCTEIHVQHGNSFSKKMHSNGNMPDNNRKKILIPQILFLCYQFYRYLMVHIDRLTNFFLFCTSLALAIYSALCNFFT